MELQKTQSFTKEGLAKHNISYHDVFEEIPIHITNSSLVNAFLLELEDSNETCSNDTSSSFLDCDFERLNLSTNPFLEKNIEYLVECLDELANEQNTYQQYQRNAQRQQAQVNAWVQKRKMENAARKLNGEEPLPEEDPSLSKPIPEPSRLPSLLATNQTENYCQQIKQFAATSFAKLFMIEGIHKE